uniref:Uncharacterized protein n=1 Tax=Anguilla anguilla TaxID=7936 RepID=A0A0E9TSD0_ANGAN
MRLQTDTRYTLHIQSQSRTRMLNIPTI